MITACKNYLAGKLKSIGVPEANIRTRIKKSGRYEVPNSAIVLVSDDGWVSKDTMVSKKMYTDGRGLVLFRQRYKRDLTLEVSLMTTEEADADARVTALEAALDKSMIVIDTALQESIIIKINVEKVLWDDVEAISRSVYTAQVYVKFSRPIVHAEDQPYFTDVEISKDDLNLES